MYWICVECIPKEETIEQISEIPSVCLELLCTVELRGGTGLYIQGRHAGCDIVRKNPRFPSTERVSDGEQK